MMANATVIQDYAANAAKKIVGGVVGERLIVASVGSPRAAPRTYYAAAAKRNEGSVSALRLRRFN